MQKIRGFAAPSIPSFPLRGHREFVAGMRVGMQEAVWRGYPLRPLQRERVHGGHRGYIPGIGILRFDLRRRAHDAVAEHAGLVAAPRIQLSGRGLRITVKDSRSSAEYMRE